jgi:poly(hydroxyalkanoate) granule-associated protein
MAVTNGAPAAEEIEVSVKEAQESAQAANAWFVENMRRVVMAGIGAVALTADEVERFVGKLVERGELAQKDGEKLVSEVRDRLQTVRPPAERVGERVEQVGARVEQGVEEFLNRLNIPSKRDIDDLSAKIAQLSARVEELRKSQ